MAKKPDLVLKVSPTDMRSFWKEGKATVIGPDGKIVQLEWSKELTPDDLDEVEDIHSYVTDLLEDLENDDDSDEEDEDIDDDDTDEDDSEEEPEDDED